MLNEEQLKKQREADDKKSFEDENNRRVAMGLLPLKKGEPKPTNEDLDFLKRETGQILTDYIGIYSKLSINKGAGVQVNQ